MTRFQIVYTRGARAIGVPGWPDLARSTASIERVRMVLTDNWSSSAAVRAGATVVVVIGSSSWVGGPGPLPWPGGAGVAGVAELGGEERPHEVPGHAGSHRTAADTDDVHVVILDSLPRGEVVVDEPGP